MKIFVGCTSSENIKDSYKEEVKKIASFLAKNYDLIIGGVNNDGVFGILIDEFKDKNIDLITLPIYKEDYDKNINCTYVDTTFDRTKTCYKMADKVLILPGGTGTICEIFSILEESRTFDGKEIIIFNLDNYYANTLEMIVDAVKHKFNDMSILDRIKVFNTSDDLIKYLGG
ncbi:MAG: LOG family protein [Bacilli bacterium]|nr:LOG family protein [Bacilli bacterium]